MDQHTKALRLSHQAVLFIFAPYFLPFFRGPLRAHPVYIYIYIYIYINTCSSSKNHNNAKADVASVYNKAFRIEPYLLTRTYNKQMMCLYNAV
jgi:hypothetical protein